MYPMYAFVFAAIVLGLTAVSVNATRWHHVVIFKILPIVSAAWLLFEAAIIFVR